MKGDRMTQSEKVEVPVGCSFRPAGVVELVRRPEEG